MNWLRERITHIRMTDQGCMLRAYSRGIVSAINACREVNTFIPALAYTYAGNPTEIEVAHEERAAGTSKYSLYGLVRLNFDLVTGLSIVPLQLFSLFGMTFVAVDVAVVVYIGVIVRRWIAADTMREGVLALWDRDILQFFLTGLVLFGLGLLGEYIGRIYQQVRSRPRYLIQAILERRRSAAMTRAPAFRPSSVTAITTAVVFAYHDVGVRCLSVLLAHGVDVAAGRHPHGQSLAETIWFESVAKLAAARGVPAITPEDPNTPAMIERIRDLQPDFLFSFYYRNMLKPALLALPKRGAFNMHGSLLPKYRGRVPVNWAVINGENETGATAALHGREARRGPHRRPDGGADPARRHGARTCSEKVTAAAARCSTAALPASLPAPRRACRKVSRSAVISAAANPPTGASTGGAARAKSIISCAAWRRLIRARLPLIGGKTLRILRTRPRTGNGAGGRPQLYVDDGCLLRGLRRRRRAAHLATWNSTANRSGRRKTFAGTLRRTSHPGLESGTDFTEPRIPALKANEKS